MKEKIIISRVINAKVCVGWKGFNVWQSIVLDWMVALHWWAWVDDLFHLPIYKQDPLSPPSRVSLGKGQHLKDAILNKKMAEYNKIITKISCLHCAVALQMLWPERQLKGSGKYRQCLRLLNTLFIPQVSHSHMSFRCTSLNIACPSPHCPAFAIIVHHPP